MKPEGRRKRRSRLCRHCGQRKARYRRPDGSWAADKEHDLCPACWQSALDSLRAWAMKDDDGGSVR